MRGQIVSCALSFQELRCYLPDEVLFLQRHHVPRSLDKDEPCPWDGIGDGLPEFGGIDSVVFTGKDKYRYFYVFHPGEQVEVMKGLYLSSSRFLGEPHLGAVFKV